MLGDVVAGRYRPVPWAACGWMAAALGYPILPFDFIPDFLMILGLIDDVFIVGWLLTRVDRSLAPYRRWKGWKSPTTRCDVDDAARPGGTHARFLAVSSMRPANA